MINILWLIPAIMLGAILGLFIKCSLFNGIKYDAEMYEYHLKQLQYNINELEEKLNNK